MDNIFPVMHGSMWKEPQTLSECVKTDCEECAYNLMQLEASKKHGINFCPHMDLLNILQRSE